MLLGHDRHHRLLEDRLDFLPRSQRAKALKPIDLGAGADRIVCGPGRDSVLADRHDRLSRSCERVRRR
jgi:hypothetical protein